MLRLWQKFKKLFSVPVLLNKHDLRNAHVPMRYWKRTGAGRSVSVGIPSAFNRDPLILDFSRRLTSSEVENGNLKSIVTQMARRAGKRTTRLGIDYDTAEALHEVLGAALREMRARSDREQVMQCLYNAVLRMHKDALASKSSN